jgi:hypothetical protein
MVKNFSAGEGFQSFRGRRRQVIGVALIKGSPAKLSTLCGVNLLPMIIIRCICSCQIDRTIIDTVMENGVT